MQNNWWKIGLGVLGGCLILKYFEQILSFIGVLLDVLAPLLLGCVVAYILNIVLRFLERHYTKIEKRPWLSKAKRPVCILGSFGFVAAIVAAVICLVVPEIGSSFQVLGKSIPVAVDSVVDFLSAHADEFPAFQETLENFQVDWPKLFENALGVATTGIGSIFTSAVSVAGAVFGGVVNVVIGIIFAIYVLANKEKLAAQLKKLAQAYISEKTRKVCGEFLELLDGSFSSFIVGQCTEAVILGTLCALGMLILRLPYAVMTGVIVGVTALIPVVGAYVGAAVGGFMIFMVDPMKALVFIIFLVILQQLEGNIVYPKVVGSSIGLPGMWVLAAVTLGGGLFGVLGMLVGVPLAATIYKWISRKTNLKLQKTPKQHKGNNKKESKHNEGEM